MDGMINAELNESVRKETAHEGGTKVQAVIFPGTV